MGHDSILKIQAIELIECYTTVPDLVEAYDRQEKGIPIGRPPKVNLRNNHLQYIFTWYVQRSGFTYTPSA